jgi:hypothetical protein
MKSTKVVIARRVEEVLRIRLDGAEFHNIVQYAAEQGWNVRERQLWNYVRASDALLAIRLEKDRDKLLARHVAQRRALYARAVHAADYRTALAVARDEAELQGLYPSRDKTPPPVQVNNHVVLSDSDREALRRMALARLGRCDPGPDRIGDIPAYRQVLPAAPGDPDRRGDGAGRPADATVSRAADSNAASSLRTEQPVLPVLRTEPPVLAGPPGLGEERWVCTVCGRRYRRQPGVPWPGCPACNAP